MRKEIVELFHIVNKSFLRMTYVKTHAEEQHF